MQAAVHPVEAAPKSLGVVNAPEREMMPEKEISQSGVVKVWGLRKGLSRHEDGETDSVKSSGSVRKAIGNMFKRW